MGRLGDRKKKAAPTATTGVGDGVANEFSSTHQAQSRYRNITLKTSRISVLRKPSPASQTELLLRIEGKSRIVVAGENFPYEIFVSEIGRIERKWKLV
jgi:hypothetical protein